VIGSLIKYSNGNNRIIDTEIPKADAKMEKAIYMLLILQAIVCLLSIAVCLYAAFKLSDGDRNNMTEIRNSMTEIKLCENCRENEAKLLEETIC